MVEQMVILAFLLSVDCLFCQYKFDNYWQLRLKGWLSLSLKSQCLAVITMDYLPNLGFPKLANIWESHLVERARCTCTLIHWCWRLQSLSTFPGLDLPMPTDLGLKITHRKQQGILVGILTHSDWNPIVPQFWVFLVTWCSWQDISSPTRGWTLAWQWNCQVLTTGLPGNSLHDLSLEAFKSASSVTCLWCREGSSMFWPSSWN